MDGRFSERDTEAFYDAEDAFYRSFWDSEGSLHWGVFDVSTGADFHKASVNLNRIMADLAGFDDRSTVLDLGCGNGTVAAWLCRTFSCHVTGVDLSGVRIDNANALKKQQDPETRDRLSFEKASATELPFPDGHFGYVWSQACIYHVHEKRAALREVHRVLAPGGRFVFDDLVKPKPNISEESQRYVYDRLLFDTEFSFPSYQDALKEVGFVVAEARDLSSHLKTSYERLADLAASHPTRNGAEKHRDISIVYRKMARAVDQQELGWGLYVCEKIAGPASA